MRGTVRDVVLGLAYLGCALLVVVVSLQIYNKTYSDDISVVLEAGAVGNALRDGSDVKFQGVPVGRVTEIEATTDGARLELAINPDQAQRIPRGPVARMLPQSLFGERYVALVHDDTSGETLQDGDVIEQDVSDEALQIEHLFDSLLPVLQAVQPDKLSAALGELASALDGRGEDIGDTLSVWAAYVREINPRIPEIKQSMELFADVAHAYADASPDLLAALEDLSTTGATITDQRRELDALFGSVEAMADTGTGWVTPNSDTIIRLAASSRRVLRVLGKHAHEFPCLSRRLVAMQGKIDGAFGGAMDGGAGLRVQVEIVGHENPHRGGPTLDTGGNATLCTGNARGRAAQSRTRVPAESQLVNELAALRSGGDPGAMPSWSSLVLGPLTRNATVTLR